MNRPATSPLDRKLLAVLRSLLGPVPIALVLGDTEDLPDTDTAIVGRVRIPDRSTLVSMAMSPEVAFGDAYFSGKIEMEGDLVRSLECVCRSFRVRNWSWRLLSKWLDWAQTNSKRIGPQHPPPLRSFQRFLPCLGSMINGVDPRLLPHARCLARRGAGG